MFTQGTEKKIFELFQHFFLLFSTIYFYIVREVSKQTKEARIYEDIKVQLVSWKRSLQCSIFFWGEGGYLGYKSDYNYANFALVLAVFKF